MKKLQGRQLLIPMLLIISALIFGVHYIVFKDSGFIMFYLLYDLAFLPIQVLLVTLVFNKVLEDHEKAKILKNLNMVIGVFFSEVGTELLKTFIDYDKNADDIKNMLKVGNDWTATDFKSVLERLERHSYHAIIEPSGMGFLKTFLSGKRDFLLKIIENPSLLEHQLFADSLTAIFHLQEELAKRENILAVEGNDLEHIRLDLSRANRLLLMQWVLYMHHLKKEYPYLFSFAVRTNPFDEDAKIEIE